MGFFLGELGRPELKLTPGVVKPGSRGAMVRRFSNTNSAARPTAPSGGAVELRLGERDQRVRGSQGVSVLGCLRPSRGRRHLSQHAWRTGTYAVAWVYRSGRFPGRVALVERRTRASRLNPRSQS